jgi:hypothetical protein
MHMEEHRSDLTRPEWRGPLCGLRSGKLIETDAGLDIPIPLSPRRKAIRIQQNENSGKPVVGSQNDWVGRLGINRDRGVVIIRA